MDHKLCHQELPQGMEPRSLSTAATNWEIHNEPVAIQAYLSYQCQQGRDNLVVGPCGFW